MVAPSVHSFLFTLSLSAIAVTAAPGLQVGVTGPETVNGVENLKVVTNVTNTGDETLKLLNDPRGPLSKIPTDAFIITVADGSQPDFIGAKVKYVPGNVVASGNDNAFTILAPSESATIEHDLSAAYNFTRSGAGSYRLEPRNLFYFVDPSNNTVATINADVEAHSVSVSGMLASSNHTSTFAKRATFNGCSSRQQSSILSAATAAQSYTSTSLAYLKALTLAKNRYTTWWGTFTSGRRSTLVSHFKNMNDNIYSSYRYDCSRCRQDFPDEAADIYAYVFANQFGIMYLCDLFWDSPLTGTDSMGGTIVHESSHFITNAGTVDTEYGQENCKNLARTNPAAAVNNADSHQYFVENNPFLS